MEVAGLGFEPRPRGSEPRHLPVSVSCNIGSIGHVVTTWLPTGAHSLTSFHQRDIRPPEWLDDLNSGDWNRTSLAMLMRHRSSPELYSATLYLQYTTSCACAQVPKEGVEPSRLSAPGFESGVSTVPPLRQIPRNLACYGRPTEGQHFCSAPRTLIWQTKGYRAFP